MNIIDIIEKKKHGMELSTEEIDFVVKGVTDLSIPDYQTSALLMAICLKGMSARETFDLTMAMYHSGDIIELPKMGDTLIVDKHSTGGVGDKTTLIIGPIMASLGIPVGKMSGRGLGITGGTIDKLDAIPGFSSEMSDTEFIEKLKSVGFVDAAQTKQIAPADKILYALRDVTATVDNMSLIASSIMSKKLASGADAIVLDVKCGSGAFMKTPEEAEELALTMIDIAKRAGRGCTAVISDMEQPLGITVGNTLEVEEAARFLRNEFRDTRLNDLVLTLCTEMYMLAKGIDTANVSDDTVKEIRDMAEEVITNGKAYEKFREFIVSQGGDPAFVDGDMEGVRSKYHMDITAEEGVIIVIDAGLTGKASLTLGAGRMTKEDEIDSGAGIIFGKEVGDMVKEGESVCTLYSIDEEKLKAAADIMKDAITIGSDNGKKSVIIRILR